MEAVMAKKILVCLDGSKQAERILPYATEQALQSDGKLILFRVSNILPMAIYASTPEQNRIISPGITDTAMRDNLDHATSYLCNLAQSLAEKGVEAEVATVVGPLSQSILKFIKDNGIDMVTMTTHAYKGWKRIVYGSAVEEILHKCTIPVLVVNPS
jgi:nucleotide-binding universal stress UspA family protein